MPTIAFFVVSLALLLAGLYRHGLLRVHGELAFNSQLEEWHLTEPQELHIQKGTWYFLVVGTLEEDGGLLNYLEALLTTAHLRTGNLVALALIDGHDEGSNIERYVEENGLSYAVIPLHDIPDSSLTELGIADHHRRYFLLDPDLRVVFHADFMKPRDVRLLLEKHFGSPATHTNDRQLQVGDAVRLPELKALRVDEDRLDVRSSHLIFLTSRCMSCSLDNLLSEIALHQETLKGVASFDGVEVALVFSPYFVARDVRQRLEDVAIDLPAFMASSLPGIEDLYLSEPLHGSDTLVVKVDEQGVVARILPWEEYLAMVFTSRMSKGAP